MPLFAMVIFFALYSATAACQELPGAHWQAPEFSDSAPESDVARTDKRSAELESLNAALRERIGLLEEKIRVLELNLNEWCAK